MSWPPRTAECQGQQNGRQNQSIKEPQRTEIVSIAGRFNFIQVLEVWIPWTPYPWGCKTFPQRQVSVMLRLRFRHVITNFKRKTVIFFCVAGRFHIMQVLEIWMILLILGTPDHQDCKNSPLNTVFRYTQVTFQTGFTVCENGVSPTRFFLRW